MRALLVFTLTPLLSLYLHAQNWPVQVSTQLVPPFSGYLNDYSSPNNDNLRIYLTLTDFSLPSYDVKLKFKLTGNNITIQSKSWYYAGPFTLEPGVPLLISGSDLSGMLNQNNLDYAGITAQQYNQTKVLPEGFYTISVIAYDFQNPLNVQVSNEASTQAWMMLCDPPLISLPLCGSEVTITNPQQLTFSWSPLNMSAPSSALGHEYLFELWEVMPPNNAPGNVVASTAPIYSTTTTLTILNYGIAEPPLQTGWTYVWRVRAYDLEGRELFRNNGYSQICTFTWGNSNNLLGNLANLTLTAQALTHRQARCMWDSNAVYTSYHLEYRKINTANWFPVNTTRSSERITSLEPQTTYEAQVHGIFSNGDDGPWSNIVTFTTPAQALLNCGESSPPPSIQNFSPLTQATTGMLWQVGQFEMSVTSLSNMSHPNGLYTGMGKMIMPLGITLNCSFSNIQIGTDMVMYNGEVKAVTEGVGSWLTQWNHGFTYDTCYFFNGGIDSVIVSNGTIIIIDQNGNQITVPIDPNGGVLITDSNGNQWVVNPDGTVTFVSGGYILPLNNDTLNAQEMRIMKAAMTIIRGELTPTVVSSQQSSMNVYEQQLQNRFNQQQQNAVGGHTPVAGSQPVTDDGEDVQFVQRNVNLNNPDEALGNQYKTAQVDYYSSQVLLVMSRENCPDAELHFVGQYLAVNGIAFKQYLTQQLLAGKTESEIAQVVAENGIKAMVRRTIIHQMSPH
jgi:Fibronectin type III domain